MTLCKECGQDISNMKRHLRRGRCKKQKNPDYKREKSRWLREG